MTQIVTQPPPKIEVKIRLIARPAHVEGIEYGYHRW